MSMMVNSVNNETWDKGFSEGLPPSGWAVVICLWGSVLSAFISVEDPAWGTTIS